MDFTSLFESLQVTLGATLPRILGALAILVAGWLVAVIIRVLVRKSLGAIGLNQRVQSGAGGTMDLEGGLARGGYYLVLLLALIAFFNVLNLPLVSAPLQGLVEQILAYLPNLIAGGALALVAWIVATVVRTIATRALASTRMDEKLSAEAGMRPMSESLGQALYGLVLLVFLPGVLHALGLGGLLAPVQGMVNDILAILPNLLAAVVLGVAGWFVAHLLRNLVTSLLAAAGADRLGERAGLRGKVTLSRLVGLVVFAFVLLPALVAALSALRLEPISRPATDMLSSFLAAIPNVFAAAVILGLTFFVARLLAELATTVLEGIGFDRLPAQLGLPMTLEGSALPSVIAGKAIVFFAMLFATVEAAGIVGFTQVSDIVTRMIDFGGQVLLGTAIIAAGLWISTLAHAAVSRLERADAAFMAGLVRYGILGLVLAMGLRAMGIADDIVNLAFALTLGAVAVAFALAFGLGGREPAGRQLEHWFSRLRNHGQ